MREEIRLLKGHLYGKESADRPTETAVTEAVPAELTEAEKELAMGTVQDLMVKDTV